MHQSQTFKNLTAAKLGQTNKEQILKVLKFRIYNDLHFNNDLLIIYCISFYPIKKILIYTKQISFYFLNSNADIFLRKNIRKDQP